MPVYTAQAQPQPVVTAPLRESQVEEAVQVESESAAQKIRKSVEKAQQSLSTSVGRLGCSSNFLMVIGVLGVVMSVSSGANARKYAQYIAEHHKLPFGDRNARYSNGHSHKDLASLNDPVSKGELEAYDILKTMALISFVLSVLVITVGHFGRKATAALKSDSDTKTEVRRLKRHSLVALVAIVLTTIISVKQGHQIKRLVKHL
mmetsp:Transcript_5257/g.8878  ORF Transcript_5257/g.8878 Transcript_5257/m.8878 type:complete len:204 (-) Transcript_5257:854-1465(-)